ncbi:uncharacterized protein [Rutidosis leptorrhynchoides]|uniref:uncharacterized protein isoform X6 n=1 Tax=Rutidosis leptorrhynchoides TaxID=125765 RepID=UPI003A998DBF
MFKMLTFFSRGVQSVEGDDEADDEDGNDDRDDYDDNDDSVDSDDDNEEKLEISPADSRREYSLKLRCRIPKSITIFYFVISQCRRPGVKMGGWITSDNRLLKELQNALG